MTLPPLRSGHGLFVVVNPRSGRTRHRPDPVPVLRAQLPDAVVHVLAPGEDLGRVLRERPGASGDPVALGVSGGDGSVSAAAAVALETGLPLLVLPGGTDNHFARLIGVDTIDIALTAAAAGTGAGVDVARVALPDAPPIVALNTVNVGLYPRFVRLRQRLEPRIGRGPAMVAAAARVAVRAAPLRMTIDGRALTVWTLFVGVGSYLPASGAPLRRGSADDGVLDVRLVRSGPLQRASAVLALLRHGAHGDQLGPRTHRLEQRRVTRLQVSGSGEHRPDVAHDGEAVHPTVRGPYRATVEVLPGAVQVYRPARNA